MKTNYIIFRIVPTLPITNVIDHWHTHETDSPTE